MDRKITKVKPEEVLVKFVEDVKNDLESSPDYNPIIRMVNEERIIHQENFTFFYSN